MQSNDIFEMTHSNNIDLTPLKNLNNDDFEQLINNFDLDINNFYSVQNKLYPYCYSKDTVLVEIYEMSKNFFETFRIKKTINQRIKMHEKCIENNNYHCLFSLIDKPFRFTFFQQLFEKIPNDQKYEVFKYIYSSSEYGFEGLSKEFIQEVFKHKPEENKWFENDTITIYRGEGSKSRFYQDAYSWTTDIKVAKFFANRFDSIGDIYKGEIEQFNVLDYITDRNEDEILTFSENVKNVQLINK
jgi:hypothetical protein